MMLELEEIMRAYSSDARIWTKDSFACLLCKSYFEVFMDDPND